MSYLVLARKYRPRNFDALVGQAHVVQSLANALQALRLHHAYLFTGTRGVGKTTVARILAKSLNCTGADGQGGITASPCGVCEACLSIDSGRFVDYVELDAASNRRVEEITQLLDQAVYKPVLGRFKVYMIDEVHMLSTHAFNAMLKTLEEPPDYLKFVLATTDRQKVPATVLSRCLQFNLRPLALQTIQTYLAEVLAQEKIDADAVALRLIARAAHGSMRDALSLTDQAIAFGAGSLREASVRQMLGAVDRGHAVRLVEALAARDGAAVVAAIDALRALGLSGAGTLEEMASLLQQMAVAQAAPDAIDSQDPEASEVTRLAGLLPADETQLLYSIVLHGRAELGLAPDEYSGLVMVLLRLLAFPSEAAPVPDAAHSPGAAGASSRGGVSVALGPTAPSEPQSMRAAQSNGGFDADAAQVSPANAQPLIRTALGDRWEQTVQTLIRQSSVTALARELALQAQCVAIDGSVWNLRVERESLCAPAHRDKLRAALSLSLTQEIALEVEVGATDDTPARREAAARAQRQRQAEQIIQDDPVVQAVLQQYSTARIVPGSIKPS